MSGDHSVRLNTTQWPIAHSTVKERWKGPREGSEREPETLCLQAVEARKCDGVLFVERSGELWWVVFSLTEWSPLIPTRFLVSRGTLDTALLLSISDTRLSRFLAGLPRPFSYQLQINYAVLTPKDKSSGLGSFPFARRYSGNRCFFLFLRVLRCFSSPGSLSYTMYSCMSTQGLLA